MLLSGWLRLIMLFFTCRRIGTKPSSSHKASDSRGPFEFSMLFSAFFNLQCLAEWPACLHKCHLRWSKRILGFVHSSALCPFPRQFAQLDSAADLGGARAALRSPAGLGGHGRDGAPRGPPRPANLLYTALTSSCVASSLRASSSCMPSSSRSSTRCASRPFGAMLTSSLICF